MINYQRCLFLAKNIPVEEDSEDIKALSSPNPKKEKKKLIKINYEDSNEQSKYNDLEAINEVSQIRQESETNNYIAFREASLKYRADVAPALDSATFDV